MWFFWDLGLTLFDIAKDVVLPDIFGSSNIFSFPVVNWFSKWAKTVCVNQIAEFLIQIYL